MDMLLELDHISKIYGDLHAVDDLSLTVPQGEWLAIVGSSGSGKTTLMNMIGCMDTPSKGSVSLEGRKLEDLNAGQLADVRKNLIGLVFQKFYLVPHLTAVENVMVAQYYHSVVDEKQALEALKKVGLKDRAHHLPSQLSGGEQQRVCVARALINNPKLILADEPTGNLDEKNEKIVLDLFRQLHDQGTTVIVVTHDASALQTHALFKDMAPQASHMDTVVMLVCGIIFIWVCNRKYKFFSKINLWGKVEREVVE